MSKNWWSTRKKEKKPEKPSQTLYVPCFQKHRLMTDFISRTEAECWFDISASLSNVYQTRDELEKQGYSVVQVSVAEPKEQP